jgi:hypothetical protein
MLKLVWFISRPEKDIVEAEKLYQVGHVRRGMRQENLQSFRISRAFQPQPDGVQAVTGQPVSPVFRFSEGYWESFEDIQACYNSPNGLAALADGMLNASPRIPATPLPVLLAEEEELPSRGRINFDIFKGRFVGERPAKLFVFLKLRGDADSAFDLKYREFAPCLEELESLGPHFVSRTRPYDLPLGKARHWPPEGTTNYERILEYYFPSHAQLESFTAGQHFKDILALSHEFADEVLPIAVEPQHVFFTTTGDQPLTPEWLAVYS